MPSEDEADDGTESGSDRLDAMMDLLEDHDDKWTASEDGRYEVTLPGDEVERVRTRDDVRALLYKHYD